MCLPLTIGHLHGLQLGVGSSVEALHLLLFQSLQQTNGVLVDAASLRQHQWGGAVVVTIKQDNRQRKYKGNQIKTVISPTFLLMCILIYF